MDNHTKRAYLVGGGIASLAAAAFLIRDGNIPGKNIMILDDSAADGGGLDGSGQADKGYVIRGGRTFNFTYDCTYDLLSSIPSLNGDHVSVYDEILAFNKEYEPHFGTRLIGNKRRMIDASFMPLSDDDLSSLENLLATTESLLDGKSIKDWFSLSFFKSNFWYLWASTFAFTPSHSLAEFRRYLLRLVHVLPYINKLAGVDRTPFNHHDSIALPLIDWLRTKGVLFITGAEVFDLDIDNDGNNLSVQRIRLMKDGEPECLSVAPGDLVFITIGSTTSGSALGSMNEPPLLTPTRHGPWALWEKLAARSATFGRPLNFSSRTDESKYISFTVTCNNPFFFDWMKEFTGAKARKGGPVTLVGSSWLLSVDMLHQPYFRNQPANVGVFWGYGLFPDKPGNFVNKTMSKCSGAEILTELFSHLELTSELPGMLNTSICIPCTMPYISSPFLTRSKGDRPSVVPAGTVNLALLGQYSEIDDDLAFTIEYSVHGAMIAVYKLLGLNRTRPV